MAAAKTKVRVHFEVFGRVQGVFFRKHTKKRADELGLKGWVKNTEQNTVVGAVEGSSDKVAQMKKWLKTEGSPKSHISKCVFTDDVKGEEQFTSFMIRR